ncbi:MAG: NAD(P)-binding domain-containing protein [Chloroflexi bacterium]|nr:NAD(P)-binding domain-containing protein [Chloroflexota bacterium]
MPPLPNPRTGARGERSQQLERLVVAGATVRDVDTAGREALAVALESHSDVFSERVLLHTCHRVELVAFAEVEEALVPLPDVVHQISGLAAAERVMLVAGGLDSAVLAEEQILGQVRDAYSSSLEQGQTGPVTNELFRRAIRFGKRVRSFAQPIGDRSLADSAARWLEQRLTPPDGRPLRALVIGTGEMGRALAAHLGARGARVTLASRSADRAERVIASLPHPERHQAALLSQALAVPLSYDVVAIAVRDGIGRLDASHLAGHPPLVVDLSSPGSVTPAAAARLGDRLLDLDQLGVPGDARRLAADVEQRLRTEARAEANEFAEWLEIRANGDAVAMLRAHGDDVRRRHLMHLRLKHTLDQEQAAAVEAMTVAMLGELLHAPIVRLRRNPDAAARVREVFGIE